MTERVEGAQTVAPDSLGLAVDRDADVPVGVQIAWALRARIAEGTLAPGARLPGLRELAETTGVNVNTARTVYQRLEQAGIVDSQQGTGTFVAAGAKPSALGTVAALAAEHARDCGISARDLAAALYVHPETIPGRRGGEPQRRRQLRDQITALEMAAAELERDHSVSVPAANVFPTRRGAPAAGPRLLSVAELEAVRAGLVRRLAAVQAAIDGEDENTGTGGGRPARNAEVAKPKRSAAVQGRPRRRPPRAGLAGA
jgi:DNA-binding transcriptional regulator YhcF (GntR family)